MAKVTPAPRLCIPARNGAEEMQELSYPLRPHEMLREKVSRIIFAAHLAQLERPIADAVLDP